METGRHRIQDYIDHSRFLTSQSAQLLRNAIVALATRKAEEVADCPDTLDRANASTRTPSSARTS